MLLHFAIAPVALLVPVAPTHPDERLPPLSPAAALAPSVRSLGQGAQCMRPPEPAVQCIRLHISAAPCMRRARLMRSGYVLKRLLLCVCALTRLMRTFTLAVWLFTKHWSSLCQTQRLDQDPVFYLQSK